MKPKKCSYEGCNANAWTGGKQPMCKSHMSREPKSSFTMSPSLSPDKPKKQKTASKIVKNHLKKSPLKPISDKRAEQMKVYRERRDKYMKDHPVCEVRGCSHKSVDLHHKKGRDGDNYTNPEYFMAVCRPCHVAFDLDPKWAMENGYIISRLI